MKLDVLVRSVALAAIPVIAGSLYLARGSRPASESASTVSAVLPSSLPETPTPRARDLAERGESALAGEAPAASKPTPETAAAELPLADSPTLPKLRVHSSRRAERPRSAGASACGGIEAKLITASDDPAFAFASLSPGLDEPAEIRRVGEAIGSWRVDRIEWDRVWLRAGGTRCAVGMHLGAREEMEALADAGPSRKAALVAVDDYDPKEPWRLPGEIANAIDKRSETEFVVERPIVKAIFERGGALLSGLKVTPSRRGEEVVGLELGDVRADSLLERLGVEDGDVVLSIDDAPAKNLESVVKALAAVREREQLVARFERKGETFDLKLSAR